MAGFCWNKIKIYLLIKFQAWDVAYLPWKSSDYLLIVFSVQTENCFSKGLQSPKGMQIPGEDRCEWAPVHISWGLAFKGSFHTDFNTIWLEDFQVGRVFFNGLTPGD